MCRLATQFCRARAPHADSFLSLTNLRRAANDEAVNRTVLSIATCAMAAMLALVGAACATGADTRDTAEARAVRFLAREVPAWPREHRCFSCHNNGDAARALYEADRLGHRVPRAALSATTKWVSSPSKWDENKGDPAFSDKRLANIQFAAALVASFETGHSRKVAPLRDAARRVAADQHADGSWPVSPPGTVGSPATYGTTLATYMALRSLKQAGDAEFVPVIGRGERWLRGAATHSVPDAAAQLLEVRDGTDEMSARLRERCVAFLRRAQTSDGGWGPFPDSPSEAFDTAIALLALVACSDSSTAAGMIRRGRAHLVATQESDGGWPATTRPPRGESYAQRLSTTGWATLALLATRDLAGAENGRR